MQFFKKKDQLQSPKKLLSEDILHTHFAESYRTLRTNIHFSGLEHNVCSLLITSAGAQEGKTSTAVNLGWTMARQSQSVVLIDCDLRRPGLSQTVDSSASPGVTGLVTDMLGTPVSGTIEEKWTLPDIITLIDLQKKTGKLTIRDQHDTVELYFISGKPVDLAWPSCPEQYRLRTLLTGERKEYREQAVEQYLLGEEYKERVSVFLHNIEEIHGVNASDLQLNISVHIKEVLSRVHAMTDISFAFEDRPEMKDYPVEVKKLEHLLQERICSKERLPVIDNSIRNALIQTEERLMVLPAGQIPPNPSELISSARLHFLLSRLKNLFDFVIVDTPPILPVSDALLLSHHVDGVIMVTRAAYMNRLMITKAVDQLQDTKARFLGMVLNMVNLKRERYYRYAGKYSADYYGQQKK